MNTTGQHETPGAGEGWSHGVTNTHYDQDPRLFQLFLDASMKYSPGLFPEGNEDLETAQHKKMHFIARQLGLQGGERVLDVGCGWGSLVCFLAREYGCEVVGVTPAARQADYIRARAARLGVAGKVRIEVGHFHEVSLPTGAFQGISFVGSITHFPDKPGTLARAWSLLKPTGNVYLSETCFGNAAKRREFESRPGTKFVLQDTFGWAELIPVSDYVRYFEDAGFSLRGLVDLTAEYSRTIELWSENARRNSQALDAIEPNLSERLLKYFEISNAGWGYTSKQYALVASKRR
ncbi:SAM-dependent methyltransferase [Cystobacter fuscus]|uniref:SAM-dependent methyltransferase n=1 Tax=Cystobacter fuscus TaxID=43 RepID=UPI002B2FBECC|nr:class I SAM-dependent methyltransferase [Cystobacter fuscus]